MPSIRDCHPSPVARKYATTSGLYRTDSKSFLFSDLGLPRSARIGTMACSCAFVSGLAPGSAFAAATIFAFSPSEGITSSRLVEVFDIVLHLSTFSAAQADDSAHVAAIYEGRVVEGVSLWRKCDHS